ncbi:MAG: alpha/beta hydrolase [Hyphomicrobiaceae bacterium]|nr:alpha/beta hydrolase [Hyphomicrobiaceae bacterium]
MPVTMVDGVRLETRLIPGRAGKPWLVLLHEGLGSVSLWRDFPDKLARHTGLATLLYSRRGYGRSEPLDGPRKPDFMHREALDALPRLLDAHGIGRAVLVGHSDGASIALIMAAHRPERVAGAVLMAPHVMVEPISQQSIARIVETYETTDLRSRLARHHANVDDAFLGWSRIWLDPRFRTWSLGPECQRLVVPALLIQGEDDEYGTLAQLDAIEALAPVKPQRLVLPGCGHAPWREKEAEVLAAIAPFVAHLSS